MATRSAKKSTVYRIPDQPDRRKAERRRSSPYRLLPDLEPVQLIEDAKSEFYKDPNVIGVGIGECRRAGVTLPDETVLIAYVKEKLPTDTVSKEYVIPPAFKGMGTDVVAPFGPDAPLEAVGFVESHQVSDDMSFIDWPRLHEQRMLEAGGEIAFHGNVQDFGDVCVIEDDGTLIQSIGGQQVVDYVRAYQLFRTTHPDIYDFVTFFTDSRNGMPPQGGSSWYRFVFNDTQGIGFGPFDQRATYGSNVLQGIMFLNQGHFPSWRYVMLQEQQHRWAAFARYRDTETGPNQNDHLLGGWAHWALNFDDDKSPMDYDVYDWVEENGNFRRIALQSEERTYCNLDLYLMGLLSEQEVGDFYLLSNVSLVSGNLYSANKKTLNIHNILWAEGARSPSVATSQKLFKNGFVVLTGDIDRAHDLVDEVDDLRRRFESDFFEATKSLARVDTTLGPVREELTPTQVKDLTDGGYTSLHRHIVRSRDLRITGTQFQGTINAGQTQRWFTHSWPVDRIANWVIVPTTVIGGGPKLTWDVATERTGSGLTYWITIRNVGTQTISYDARYSVVR